MTEKQKLMVIDTDGGSDDVLAMMMALSHPDWKVLAITAVFGNVHVDVAYTNVLRILNFYKKTNISVYKGCNSGLLFPFQTDHYHGSDGLSGNAGLIPLPENVKKSEEPAANALVQLAKEYPGQITLIALGPLTNLVIAQRLDPNFSSNLKDLMIMGGNTSGKGNVSQCAEFNFHCDPESAEIVFREFKNITITPWETCITGHLMQWDAYDRWTSGGTPKSELVSKITAAAANRSRDIVKRAGYHCCDLLAMTATLYPHLITKKQLRHTQVELQGKSTRGMMVVEWRDHVDVTPNADIILEMDSKGVQSVWEKLLI